MVGKEDMGVDLTVKENLLSWTYDISGFRIGASIVF